MSELTRCNYCTLQEIKQRHGADKVTLALVDGWTAVVVEGHSEPVAYFLTLTSHCVC